MTTVVSRDEWGSRNVTRLPWAGALAEMYVHHTGGSMPSSISLEVQQMRTLQHIAINTNKISDLPYNYVIGPSGRIYEGRGMQYKSAATLDRNNISRSICVMGNYQNVQPTPESINAVVECAVMMAEAGYLSRVMIVRGHRENPAHVGATACPGKNLQPRVPNIAEMIKARLSGIPPEPPQPEPPIPPNPQPPTSKEIEMPFTVKVVNFTAAFLRHNDATLTHIVASEAAAIFAKYGPPVEVATWADLAKLGTIVGNNPGQV